MNIVDIIAAQARAQPHAVALLTAARAIGYAELVERVTHLAAALAAQGVQAGERVAVRLPNGPLHVLTVLALARLGAVAMPLHPQRPGDQLRPLMERHGVSRTLGLQPAHAIEGSTFVTIDETLLAAARPQTLGAVAEGDDRLVLIGLSSGSTGLPKAVAWSHRRIIRHWELVQRLVPHGPGVRSLMFLGLDGNYPLQSVLRMLFSGGTAVLTTRVNLASLADAVDRLGANDVVSSPSLMARLLDELPPGVQRFPGLKRMSLGGSAIPPSLLERLKRQLCSNIEVSYGTTEAGRLAIGSVARATEVPNCVGTLAPWVEAQALDDEGRVLPPGSLGLLRFRSDAFADGYLDNPEASAAVFRDGWYWPGDVGRILDDGGLVVEGRADDIINLGGTKVAPGEVEAVLLEDPAIADAAAYAAEGEQGIPRLLAAVVVRPGYDEVKALRRCRAVLGQKAPMRLVTVPALPRNSQGKLLRHELASRTRITSVKKAVTT